MEDFKINSPASVPEDKELLGSDVEVIVEPPLWQIAWQRLERRLDEFQRWAAPEVGPEREQERSFMPVAALLGVAIVGQYLQLSLPFVRSFLVEHDPGYRSSWSAFLIFKQGALFALMLLMLAIKEERLSDIGFPRLDARRVTLALGLFGLCMGAAVLRVPSLAAQQTYLDIGVAPGERALSVLTALGAALMEESFFRGFAIVWIFRWSRNLPLAVMFPALVFAAGHAHLSWGNVPFAFAGAMAFSGLFLWRRDLYWAMVLHFAVNNVYLFF